MIGPMIPSFSVNSAASRCSGSICALPRSVASSCALTTASCAFSVNLSNRNAIVLSPLSPLIYSAPCPLFQSFNKRATKHTEGLRNAINCVRHGVDIRRLQQVLGHSNINTTAVCLKFNDQDLQEVYANVPFSLGTRRV